MINKFKVYDSELGFMYSPEEIETITFNSSDSDSSLYSFVRKDDGITFYQKYSDRFVVLNYSGFKDSDGNEIYELDLLNSNKFPGSFYRVYYFEPTGEWQVTKVERDGSCEEDCIPLSNVIYPWAGDTTKITIFGNYYTHDSDKEEEE